MLDTHNARRLGFLRLMHLRHVQHNLLGVVSVVSFQPEGLGIQHSALSYGAVVNRHTSPIVTVVPFAATSSMRQ